MDDLIDHTFDAAEDSPIINAGEYAMRITGTFSATIELQARIGGVWDKIADAYTAEQTLLHGNNGAVIPMKFVCTTYVSGDPKCVLKRL